MFIIVVLHGITAEIIFWRCAMANHWVEDVIRLTRYLTNQMFGVPINSFLPDLS